MFRTLVIAYTVITTAVTTIFVTSAAIEINAPNQITGAVVSLVK